MTISEFACIFPHPPRERLGLAAQFVSAIPAFLSGAEGELDVHHSLATGYTAVLVRAAGEVFTPEVLARLGFWSARAGARRFRVETLSEDDRACFRAELDLCDRAMKGASLREAQKASQRFFRGIGVVSSAHPTGARMVLAMDIDGPSASAFVERGSRGSPHPSRLPAMWGVHEARALGRSGVLPSDVKRDGEVEIGGRDARAGPSPR